MGISKYEPFKGSKPQTGNLGYRKRDTKSVVVHLLRNCRCIKKEQVVEVRLKGQQICLVCSKGISHTSEKQTSRALRATYRSRPSAKPATNTTQSVEDIASQLQGMNLNLNGAVTLNASVAQQG